MSEFFTPYENYIFKSRYARYIPEENRRETWNEAVERYIQFFRSRNKRKPIPWDELKEAILKREIMPSMRALMTAGPALDKDNVAGYNCAYVAVDNPRVFDEIMYILMCGTGVGFSVERQYISKLPEINEEFYPSDTVINVRDSKVGWASAYRSLISELYAGQIPRWNLGLIRKQGSRLNTFGGRASGPEPLDRLMRFTVATFQGAKGRKLNSLEVHDIICKIAEVVVCGGVRRSALLSLSNLTDQRMRNAKAGDWYLENKQRRLANNSAAYTEKPDLSIFMEEWRSLYISRSGERGIFNREAASLMVPARRNSTDYEFGTNPCSEIILRSKQFCNLSEVCVRSDDNVFNLRRKIRLATILGTLQATLVDFRYLSHQWKRNTEEERLLGVSLTGIMDHPMLSNHEWHGPEGENLAGVLNDLKQTAIEVNKQYAEILGIPESTAITCIKPSGTVSQLCNTSSGIHPRYAKYYIRRVRADVKDPLCNRLIEAGIPYEKDINEGNEFIFSFPIASPRQSLTVKDIKALRQLEHWKVYATTWCEHKPSCSIYVRNDEWFAVADWVYNNWDICNGLSFFPVNDHIYEQAPYEEVSEEAYTNLVNKMPVILDLDTLNENEDNTTGSQELACTGGACEL